MAALVTDRRPMLQHSNMHGIKPGDRLPTARPHRRKTDFPAVLTMLSLMGPPSSVSICSRVFPFLAALRCLSAEQAQRVENDGGRRRRPGDASSWAAAAAPPCPAALVGPSPADDY